MDNNANVDEVYFKKQEELDKAAPPPPTQIVPKPSSEVN